MRLCNDTITVFNKRIDTETRNYIYVPTVIHNVSWYGAVTTNLGDKGLVAANHYTVRIPLDANFGGKAYTDPISYAGATTYTGLFTLQNGDIIIKGDAVGTSTTPVTLTPAQIHDTYPDCMTVLGVTDNRRAPHAPHFRVVGG